MGRICSLFLLDRWKQKHRSWAHGGALSSPTAADSCGTTTAHLPAPDPPLSLSVAPHCSPLPLSLANFCHVGGFGLDLHRLGEFFQWEFGMAWNGLGRLSLLLWGGVGVGWKRVGFDQ